MPLSADNARRLRFLDHMNNFRMRPLLRKVRVDVEITETAPEGHQAFVRERLIAKEDHKMFVPGTSDFRHLLR